MTGRAPGAGGAESHEILHDPVDVQQVRHNWRLIEDSSLAQRMQEDECEGFLVGGNTPDGVFLTFLTSPGRSSIGPVIYII